MASPKRERANAAAENSLRAKWRRIRHRDNREPSTRRTPLFDKEVRRCWCGLEYGHPWEGKDDGAPHPR